MKNVVFCHSSGKCRENLIVLFIFQKVERLATPRFDPFDL